MAGIDLGVVGQTEQALDDVGSELLIAAPREVGAAYAAAEERVASEDPTLYLCIEADATHGMTRRTNDFQSALPYLDDFAVLQVDIGQLAVTREGHPEHRRLLSRSEEVVLHVGMRRHLDAITLFDGGVAHDMVDVTMRIDDHQGLEAMAVDEAEELILLAYVGAARVDDDTVLGGIVVDDVGVFREGIEDKGFELKHFA